MKGRNAHFSLKNSKNLPEKEVLLAGIIAYGCNINILKMAKISKGVTENDLNYAINWYFTNENLLEANNKIIELTDKFAISKIFRKNEKLNHTASDGQKFNISVDSLNSGYSQKYFGLGKGVSRYTFIDESHRLFYSTVINVTL